MKRPSFGPLFDLHTHTTASDGRLAPRELVRQAAKKNITALAVTDHDTVEGIDEALEEAGRAGMELIPGIEVSANYDSASVHVLGLFIRHDEPWLSEFFSQARERRIERIHRIVEKLADRGVRIRAEDVFAKSTHGTVGRPHVAEVLVERGIVANTAEAFDRYLGHEAPAYVGYERITVREAIELIQKAGGVASLAHPGLLERDELIPMMVGEGLQAIEAFHRDHTPEQCTRYVELAERLRVLVTGGSDFHTLDGGGRSRLGCRQLSGQAFEKIREAARRG